MPARKLLPVGMGMIMLGCMLLICQQAWSQDNNPFYDGFEDGDMNGWTLLDGNAEVSSDVTHTGGYALRAGTGVYSRSHLKRDNFSAFNGTYEAWFYVSGDHADGRLYFQYQDVGTHYLVSVNPLGTDNPGTILYKKTGGDYQVLGRASATYNLDEWVKCTVQRYLSGTTEVFINGHLVLTASDKSIEDPGGFCIGSWQNAYIDDVYYTDSTPNPCAGGTPASTMGTSPVYGPLGLARHLGLLLLPLGVVIVLRVRRRKR